MNDLQTKGNGAKTVTPATDKTSKAAEPKNPKTETKTDLEAKKTELQKILSPVTAEQRIKNAENFQKLAEKHTFLTVKNDELNAFMIGRDGLREKICIMNDNEQTFEISNTAVIEEVLNLCSQKLGALIEESKEQILTFSI